MFVLTKTATRSTSARLLNPIHKRNFTEIAIAAAVTAVAPIALAAFRFKVASPHEYLVKTGLGITDINLHKKCVVWPGQSHFYINLHPENYEFQLSALSIEKIPFILPGFFTIGPKDDPESLIKFVRFLNGKDIHQMILGILEGETRILSSTMTLEEIFNNRQSFKETIIKGVQEELNQFGLFIYNANIKEMRDGDKSNYFDNMMKKKESQTANMAKVDVAEADKSGKVGEKEREAETRQRIAAFEAATIRQENDSRKDIQLSNSELAVITAQTNQIASIAQIESVSNSNIKKHETEVTVQEKKQNAETATYRASKLAPATVDAEITMILSNAELYKQQQIAEGIKAIYNAKAEGLQKVLLAVDGNQHTLNQFMMIETDQFQKLAHENATGLQNLKPTMTFLHANTGGAAGENNPIGDLFRMAPLTLAYLGQQLGLTKDKMPNEEPKLPMIIPNTNE